MPINAMKEEEALKRWCPFVRAYDPDLEGHDVTSTNRPLDYPDGPRTDINCIGSRCMAWRWAQPEANRWGYCGLAGDRL